MDHRTGMPHKWLYSNDDHWSHSEYDTIYKHYTEGLPQQAKQQKASSSKIVDVNPVKSVSSSSSATTAKREQKNVVSKSSKHVETTTTTTTAAAPSSAAVTEKRKETVAEVQQVTQPGKVAAMVDAINKQLEHAKKQFQHTAAAVPSAAAAAAASTEASELSSSLLTSANAFRVAVGHSIVAQVQEMRSFAANTATQAAGKVKEVLPISKEADGDSGSFSVAELKSQLSITARRGASLVVEGANTAANTAVAVAGRSASAVVDGAGAAATFASRSGSVVLDRASSAANTAAIVTSRGASVVAEGAGVAATAASKGASRVAEGAGAAANTAVTVAGRSASAFIDGASTVSNTAVSVASRGASAVADGAGTAATVASQQAAELLTKAESFSTTLGSAVLSQAAEFKKAASNALHSMKQGETTTTTAAAAPRTSEKKKATATATATKSVSKAIAAPAPKQTVVAKKTKTPAAKSSTIERNGVNNALSAAAAAAAAAPKFIGATTGAVVDGATAAASTAAQQAGVLLGRADAFKNSLGGAVLSQASNFKNAANEALSNTKKAITSTPAAAPAAAPAPAADKKKDAKSVKKADASAASAPSISMPRFFSNSAAKPVATASQPTAKKQQKGQQQQQQREEKQSAILLARAESFRQTLGHAVLSQVSAFKQAAVNAKSSLPTLPALRIPSIGSPTTASSSAKQAKTAAKAALSTAQKQSKNATKPAKTAVKTSSADTKKQNTPSASPLSKATVLAESLSKDVVVMKDAIVAAFAWKPTTLVQGTASSSSSSLTTTSSKDVSSSKTNNSKKGRAATATAAAAGAGVATASPLWGWANTIVHPVTKTSTASASPEKTSWFTAKQATVPEKTSWFTGKAATTPEKTSWFPSTSGTSAAAPSSSQWGWNPSTYFSPSSSAPSGTKTPSPSPAPFGWSPRNFAPASPSSSSSTKNGAAANAQWNWAPTNFFPITSSTTNPQWSWNPTSFSSTPRVALIAAGLIGFAYILGVAWQKVNSSAANNNGEFSLTQGALDTASAATTSSSGNSREVIGLELAAATAAAAGVSSQSGTSSPSSTSTDGFSSNIFDRNVSLGPSSDLYDGPALSGAGAASAAASTVGRSREELIAESQRRINAAKDALAKVEKQKAEAAAAAAAAEERVAMQEQAMMAAQKAAATAAASKTSKTSSSSATTTATKKEKSIADSFDMVRNLIHSAALVQDWGTPLVTKYDPLQNAIGTITSSKWELSDWAGPNKYCPVTDVLQGLTSVQPASEAASKYDPLSSSIKSMSTSSWTGPTRDRTKSPLRDEKYDVVAALFAAIMLQKEPPLRKNQNKSDTAWDPVAAVLDAAQGWQPPQPRSFKTNSKNGSVTISEADKYDLTASLMAGLYTIKAPTMKNEPGRRWDPVSFLLKGWAAEWEGTAADVRRPVSPTYDPAAGMKGAESPKVRSKYDWAQAVLQSEAPKDTISTSRQRGSGGDNGSQSGGGKRAWLMRASSSLKERVPKMLKWNQEKVEVVVVEKNSGSDSEEAVVIAVGSVTRAVGSDRDDY